jgi:hypothetical protein
VRRLRQQHPSRGARHGRRRQRRASRRRQRAPAAWRQPESLRTEIVARLLKLGYPEQGSVEGLAALSAGAKSFVSCAIGRMTAAPED